MSIVCKFRPVQIIKLLTFHADWIDDLESISLDQAVWIYAFLGLVDKPLHSEDLSTIRTLAKTAIKHRQELLDNEADVTYLNLLICTVANYFGQKDLSDC